MSVERRRTLRFVALGVAVVAAAGVVVAIVVSAPARRGRARRDDDDLGVVGTADHVGSPGGSREVATGPFVAVVDGNVVFVSADRSVHPLLREVHRYALVIGATGREFLVGTRPWEAMIATLSAVRFGDVLPSGVALIPDALGRWWTNFGRVGGNRALHHVTFPGGAQPVAKLRDGYLVVDAAHTSLLVVPSKGAARTIGRGNVRVLAVANDLVAWSDSVGRVVHVTNVETQLTANVDSGSYVVTARFSPDRTRLAILTTAGGASAVLADTASGRVITRLATSSSNRALPQYRSAPPALQPSPFSWDPVTHDLVVVTISANGTAVAVLGADGKVVRTTPAPTGLSQLLMLPAGVTPPVTSPVTTPAAGIGSVQGQMRGAAKGGIVLATGTGGRRFSTSAGPSGRFVLQLPSGVYTVAGRSFPLAANGRIDCTASGPVTVKAGGTTTVALTCTPG